MLFFRKEAYFNISRSYLIFTLLIVLVLPLIPYHTTAVNKLGPVLLQEVIISPGMVNVTLNEVVIKATGDTTGILGSLSISSILLAVYLTGVFVMSIKLGFNLIRISLLIRNSELKQKEGFTLVITENGSPTFSFFRWIFIDRKLLANASDLEGILAHEKIHARQFHSWDLIASELLTIIQWFNPFTYLIKKTIRENHEYITDSEVVKGIESVDYELLLLRHSSKVKTNLLTHNFSYSLLKRRLQMINKPKRPLITGIGILGAIFSFVLVLFACSTQPEDVAVKKDLTVETKPADSVFLTVDLAPEFPGGTDSLFSFIVENLKYPEKAKENDTQGTVFINFIIDKDGSVADAKVVRGISPECDAEALRVIKMMPSWEPGLIKGKAEDIPVKVSFNIPINFKLDNSSKNDSIIRYGVKNGQIKAHAFADNDRKDSIYTVVKHMPEYPGGLDALMNYLANNIKYPEEAKKANLEGRVFINFIVEEDGSVSNVKVLRGIGGGCDKEAVRVVENMPSWKPGSDENKEPVRVSFNLPINFTLSEKQ
jgi:TonB family protein